MNALPEARVWLLIVGMGVITYLLRLSMIVLIGRTPVPPIVLRALRYVPVGVFSALVAPALVRPSGAVWISPENPYLLAGTLAALVAWRTKSMVLTIMIGMAALLILR
ncbi:MAG TPA: AzlD domain-containing protein [bacterium]